ncbi:hypothetical protein K466DRAFT_626631 [Polyporus arcularius HHB13444]|uniref:F-box domain-containing protein n=1 Tax=Polyporus arcularius HHB13444 TaxID=1314778 RepID=A0A5C3Q1D4_9APHY|nr:hypothetical protein K466DRAFT_626631 [Polyporus arcularius HHB13444]
MDSLPVELVTEVAFLACTDGGRTGCSLSLVSKRIRNAVYPARFHTVALASDPEAFSKFLDVYREQRHRLPNTNPHVRHLFLSLLPIEGEPIYRRPRPSLHNAIRAYEEHLRNLRDLGERHGAAVCALMQELAPDLETFTFIHGEWQNVPTVDCTFPRLRELTLVDGMPEFLSLDDSSQPMFPRLERLHAVEFFHARPLNLCQFAQHASHLTHFRCSGMHYVDTLTMGSLRLVTADESLLLPLLRQVVVQPTLMKYHGDLHVPDRLCVELKACADKARSGMYFHICAQHNTLGPVDTREETDTAPERCIRKAREEWMQRVEGGSGCWAEEYLF